MRILASIFAFMLSVTTAMADYRLIVPQGPGAGTSVWAAIFAKHMSEAMKEKFIVEHIPGINDIPGFNKFHNELRFDDKTIMVAHGGNAESFLVDKVDYNYADYEPIATMSLNTIITRSKSVDIEKDKIRMAHNSGLNPDMMAIIMLICGPQKDVATYLDCYKKRVIYVKGMPGSEARLSFLRGELNAIRETYVAHEKFFAEKIRFNEVTDWFHHGVYDFNTGKIVDDHNFKNVKTFAQVYKDRWKVEPSGDFYEAYALMKNYRDVLQKALFVNKGNTNAEKLRQGVAYMITDPEAKKAFEAEIGDYEWFVGKDLTTTMIKLKAQITEKKLKTLVKITNEGFGFETIYKLELLK
jgi:hypothetical protein